MTQRKDFKRNNVIITEKIDKKAAQFLPADLPYPYTSKAQYEASFKMPVGAEWNSRTTHQKETMPRVVKKVSRPYFSARALLTSPARSHHRTHRETVLEFGSRFQHASVRSRVTISLYRSSQGRSRHLDAETSLAFVHAKSDGALNFTSVARR